MCVVRPLTCTNTYCEFQVTVRQSTESGSSSSFSFPLIWYYVHYTLFLSLLYLKINFTVETEWMEFWCFKLWLKSSARNKHVLRWNFRWIPSVNCKSVIQTWTPVNSTCFTLLQLSAKLSSRKPFLTQTQREKVLSLSCSGPCLITLRPTVIKHKRHRVYIQGKLGIWSTLYNKLVADARQ